MKEILLMFGSIVAILVGAILLYINLFLETFWEPGPIVGDGFGIVFLAAGLTGIWWLRKSHRG